MYSGDCVELFGMLFGKTMLSVARRNQYEYKLIYVSCNVHVLLNSSCSSVIGGATTSIVVDV